MDDCPAAEEIITQKGSTLDILMMAVTADGEANMKNDEILANWSNIKNDICKLCGLSDISYNRLFRDLKGLKFVGNDFYIVVPGASTIILSYYDNNYKQPLEKIIRKQYSNAANVIFCMENNAEISLLKKENNDLDCLKLPVHAEEYCRKIMEDGCDKMNDLLRGRQVLEENEEVHDIRRNMVIEIARIFGIKPDKEEADMLIKEGGNILAGDLTGQSKSSEQKLVGYYITRPCLFTDGDRRNFTMWIGHAIVDEFYVGWLKDGHSPKELDIEALKAMKLFPERLDVD